MKEITFGVKGMSCAACVARVERVLKKQPGVTTASVNLATERAVVTTDETGFDLSGALAAVAESGYPAVTARYEIAVGGMTCASCVQRVERALRRLPGVLDASVNLATSRAAITYLPHTVSPARIRTAIVEAGYEPQEIAETAADTEQQRRQAEQAGLRRDLGTAAVLTLPLVLIAMGPMLVPAFATVLHAWLPAAAWHWLQLGLSTPVLFVAGRRFYRLGWSELRHLSPGMNTLVMMGASAAWSYSALALIVPDVFPAGTANLYFEAAAAIITLILLGRYFEAQARGRTSEAIRKLMRLQSKTARILRDGTETELPAEAVVPGDLVVVRPGERVPVDGIVIRGASYVDESMITGEPVPAAKEADSEVIGGSINQAGAFTFRATRVGADTVLARIIRLVEEAQTAKPAIQELADRIAGVFVPVVIIAAMVTFAGWLLLGPPPALSLALVAAISVLVIACPCAMGLATPTAIMVGSGRAAEMGILFRKGTALEQLANIDTVVLDKTGTLTKGGPELTDVRSLAMPEEQLLAVAAAAESFSEHPIAGALVDAARKRGLHLPDAEDFRAEPGFGAQARIGDQTVNIGADRYMRRLGVACDELASDTGAWARQGKTPIYIALDGRIAGALAIADPLKEGSTAAIAALRHMDLNIALLTGDNSNTAQAVAGMVGIDQLLAEVLPDQKAAEIQRLQAAGRRVAFVGDGINDAPALAQADVGIAIGTGTDIAIDSADVILMSGDLRGIVAALLLARRTLRTIKLNFFWAYAYNVVLIPVAAGALYPLSGTLLNPMLAAAAMSLSSLFVVSNSLRLRRFAIEPSQRPDSAAYAPSQAEAESARI